MKKLFSLKHLLSLIFTVSFLSFSFSQQNTFQSVIDGDEDFSYPRIVDAGNNESMVLYRSFSISSDFDVMLSKLDSLGKTIWTKRISDYQRNISKEIFKTDYGFLVLLWRAHLSKIDDWHIVMVDNEGNILKEKFIGTTLDEEIQYVVPIGNNEFIVASNTRYSTTSASFSIIDSDLEVTKLKTYATDFRDQGIRSAVVTNTGNVMFCGWSTPGGDYEPLIFKTDLDGTLIFMYTLSLDGNSEFRNIIKTEENYFVAAGFTNGLNTGDYDAFLLKFREDGTILWAKTFGGDEDDKAFDILEKSDGTYLVTGETYSEGNNSDLFLINIDGEGNLLSGQVYGGEGNEYYGFADITEKNQVLLAGETDSFDPITTDIFIAKANEDGSSCCGKEIFSFNSKQIHPLTTNVYPSVINDNIFDAGYTVSKQHSFPESYLVCFDPLKIIGKSELCEDTEDEKYKAYPPILEDFYKWSVTGNAEITNKQDTAIYVNFGKDSATIYLQSIYCIDKYFDSLYVNLGGLIPDLGPDTTICSNEEVNLSPGHNYTTYLWQDGSTKSFLRTNTEGLYWVEVSDGKGCSGSDSIYISTIEIPTVNLGPDNTKIEGDFYLLDAGPGYDSYLWNDNSTYQTIEAKQGGQYWVEVSLEKCSDTDSIWLYRKPCEIEIANTFTPNGDGFNDFFFAEPNEAIGDFEMTIFNRWGRTVAETSDITYKWDGSHHGKAEPEGTYFCVINYTCAGSIKSIVLKGSITLIR